MGSTHKLPSPTNKITRSLPTSCAAKAAPRALPTDQPILPHSIWLTSLAPSGKGTSRIPKFAVPGRSFQLNIHIIHEATQARTSFRDNNILRLKEFAYPRPEVRMQDCGIVVLWCRNDASERIHRYLACSRIKVLQTLGQPGKQLLHPNALEKGILDPCMIRMKLGAESKYSKPHCFVHLLQCAVGWGYCKKSCQY